jgi:chromosome segregation ATPase
MESQRFLEIDKLRGSKLEKLKHAEIELARCRGEATELRHVLAQERRLNADLVDQNRALLHRMDSIAASFAVERAHLCSSIDKESISKDERISNLENRLHNSETDAESVRKQIASMTESYEIIEVENKSLKSSINTKQVEFNLELDRLNRELSDLGIAKDKVISDQRVLIDQLSNSMSEAATQIMESQNISKLHQHDLEARDSKIRALEEKVVWLEDVVRERTDRLISEEDISKDLNKRIEQLLREKEIVLTQLEFAHDELKQKERTIATMESTQKKSDLIQTNLVTELQSLPIINKRLESDCVFLREDLKNVSEKLKIVLKENHSLSERMTAVDSIISPEQRQKINEKTSTMTWPGPSTATELKRLQIETMELRMRLVDSQAARDKAQAQLIEQSQLIAKLQKDLKAPHLSVPSQLIGQ